MRPEEIRNHLRTKPFRPFRVFVSDGSTYDVRHPDFMFVTMREVVIGLALETADFPEQSAYIDPVHITRIEPINGQRTKDTERNSN